jgi:2,3-bisphosphoglycerate-dependent phosphoglycerate mutase
LEVLSVLALVRHGQSAWNLENRFTGWVDVPLTDKGVIEAQNAGKILKSKGFQFDVCYTSVLKRAVRTSWILLEEMDQMWIPQFKSWRLNERHYGGLQGLNKTETAQKYGDEQVKIWRRSYDIPPPVGGDGADMKNDRRYKGLTLPSGESLKNTVDRVVPYWTSDIAKHVANNENVLIVAHGNSLRGLIKHLTGMTNDEIVQFEFETGVPLICEIDSSLKLKSYNFLKG